MMGQKGNPLYIPASCLSSGDSIGGVLIESVNCRSFSPLSPPGPDVIVKLANGETLNFDLHDEVKVDR